MSAYPVIDDGAGQGPAGKVKAAARRGGTIPADRAFAQPSQAQQGRPGGRRAQHAFA
jgi:hypothetical protein